MCLGKAGEPPLLLAGVPVFSSNATRMEAMDPALTSLFLATIFPRAWGRLTLTGDSETVVDLLNWSSLLADLFLFNIQELVRDTLHGWGYQACWVPRTQNFECDALANATQISQWLTFTIFLAVSASILDSWRRLAAEFIHHFSTGPWLSQPRLVGVSLVVVPLAFLGCLLIVGEWWWSVSPLGWYYRTVLKDKQTIYLTQLHLTPQRMVLVTQTSVYHY